MAILIWIGIMMGTQAFNATPDKHAPAVVVGLMPGIAAFAALISKHMLAVSGITAESSFFSEETIQSLSSIRNFFADGMFAMEQGYVYSSIVLASATVAIIERKFRIAAIWFFSAAVLSATGFIHTYVITPFDVISSLELSMTKWTWGYLAMAVVLLVIPLVTTESDGETPL